MNSVLNPLVSVIIPTYNRAHFLGHALQSILNQTYTNLEAIVIDNYSIDNTEEIIEKFEDSRIKYFKIHNNGVIAESRNFGFSKAKGDLIAFLDSDDWWEESKLEKQIPLFNDSEVGLVYGNFWVVNERRNKPNKIAHCQNLPEGRVLDKLLEENVVGMLTMVVRRSALQGLENIFDTRYHLIDDFDLVVRLAAKCKFACIQTPVAFYRWHGNNQSILEAGRGFIELEWWYADAALDPIIGVNKVLPSKLNNITYLKIMYLLMQSERLKAIRLFIKYPLCFKKLRLLVAIILPLSFLKAIRA